MPFLPLSWIYGRFVKRRNLRYDKGKCVSTSFPLPIICVGNISVGGTGKTPHTEYLIQLLKESCHIAVLSRGYKRKTKGFILADENSGADDIGDEPMQMHRKFPDITVAVQENRVEGVQNILKLKPETDVILLDDAFQHRRIRAGLNILLTDYSHPFFDDTLLPSGRLREPVEGKDRADIIIVTKCPENVSSAKMEEIQQKIQKKAHQELFFSTIEYGEPCRDDCGCLPADDKDKPMVAFCGIAHPESFFEKVRASFNNAECLSFRDHRNYTSKDFKRILEAFNRIEEDGGWILTTEKDYSRILRQPLFQDLLPHIYYLPLGIRFVQHGDQFDSKLLSFAVNHFKNLF